MNYPHDVSAPAARRSGSHGTLSGAVSPMVSVPDSASLLRRATISLFACACLATALPTVASGQAMVELTTLYSFGVDGLYPAGGLIQGSDGNLYGTTSGGGDANNDGTVFRITPAGNLTTIYRFTGGSDGSQPYAGLVQGSNGTFYGTTSGGGGTRGDGTIFSLTTAGVLTTLHTFNGTDGSQPQAALLLAADGNFYGTTAYGGANSAGTVYRITPDGVFSSIYSFGNNGSYPAGGLVQGANGNLYGTTSAGGDPEGDGTVFELTSGGVVTTVYTFASTDGSQPQAVMVAGGDGNFYGTTVGGGASGAGTSFRLSPNGALTTLHQFNDGSDGAAPYAGQVLGSDGNLYGTTQGGGNGTLYAITPGGTLMTLYAFAETDGAQPQANLVFGSDGNLYGTTSGGGTNGAGTIFKAAIKTAPSSLFTGQLSIGNGVYYLTFPSGNYFGFYSFLDNPAYVYHYDLGFEYVFDATDGNNGAYLYDFASNDFFYTSPGFPFPFLYDFGLNSVVYYYPDPTNAGHYNTDGVRYFYVYRTGQVISK